MQAKAIVSIQEVVHQSIASLGKFSTTNEALLQITLGALPTTTKKIIYLSFYILNIGCTLQTYKADR